MKKSTIIFLILSLTVIIAGCLFLIFQTDNRNSNDTPRRSFIKVPFEIEPYFILKDKQEIYFSARLSEGYQLYKLMETSIQLRNEGKNIFKPFMLSGSVAGLQDKDGDEQFRITDNALTSYIGDAVIKKLFSFRNGYLIILQLKEDGSLVLIDLKKGLKKRLTINPAMFHSADCSNDQDLLVLNYDDKLTIVNLKNLDRMSEIFINTSGDKMNPFVHGKEIYFSDNSHSEYHRIFKINLSDPSYRPQLVYHSAHDLRVPKIKGNELFYIEIVNSEYLLRARNLQTGHVRSVTDKGVVYNYDFDKEAVIFSYTDFNTPKAIFKDVNGSLSNLTGTSLKLNLNHKFINGNKLRSPAYVISQTAKVIKGVILYFHPGLYDDFSPRWDPIIMNLTRDGYVIVSPNYPMSSGYGKKFKNADLNIAVNDILNWKAFIQSTYYGIPLFYCSSSSGNILMERALATDSSGIRATVSFFGLPSENQSTSSVPGLFILGGNDPILDFNYRSEMLSRIKGTVKIKAYPFEGHWFRNENNLYDAINTVLNFFAVTNNA
jgi:dipeptidyl aminopeptidase/acylaminoacyl peptidase